MKRPTLTLPRFYFDGCGKEAVFPILLLKAITGRVFCCNPVNLMTVQSEADQRGMFHMSRVLAPASCRRLMKGGSV